MRKVCTAARNACTTNIRTPQRAHCRGPESRYVCSADDGKVRTAGLGPWALTRTAVQTAARYRRPDSSRAHSRRVQAGRLDLRTAGLGTCALTKAARGTTGPRPCGVQTAGEGPSAFARRAASRCRHRQSGRLFPARQPPEPADCTGPESGCLHGYGRVRTSGLRTAGGYGRPSWRGL